MKQHQLGGQIGTDPNFAHATHTGHSRKHVKTSDDHPKMKLTAEEQEIYDGKKGDVLQKAINKGIKNIWVQQYSNTENTLKIAEEYNKEIIHKKCIFMFAKPVAGIHKFHKMLMKVFGKLPN